MNDNLSKQGHKSVSVNYTKTTAFQNALPQLKNQTCKGKGGFIQIWDGFIWPTPSYGRLSQQDPFKKYKPCIIVKIHGKVEPDTWDNYQDLNLRYTHLKSSDWHATNGQKDQEYIGELLMVLTGSVITVFGLGYAQAGWEDLP